jgi:hypothetical protein
MSFFRRWATREVVVRPDPLARVKRILGTWGPIAAALLVGLAIIFDLLRHYIHWGDFPTWLLGITTLLAFLAAVFAGLIAYDVLQIEAARELNASQERRMANADRRQAAEDRRQAATDRAKAEKERAADRKQADDERAARREADRRGQASKVTAWFAWLAPDRNGAPTDDRNQNTVTTSHGWGATVSNASELPVFDVRVHYFRVNGAHDGSPWTTTEVYASIGIFRVIPPGQTRNEELPERIKRQYEFCDDEVYLVGVEFTDANGQRWYRNERAALEARERVASLTRA